MRVSIPTAAKQIQIRPRPLSRKGLPAIHSLIVTGVHDHGNVTEVTGLGGTEPASHSNTPQEIEQLFGQFTGTEITAEYYHDSKPDRPVQERLDQVKDFEEPKDENQFGEPKPHD